MLAFILILKASVPWLNLLLHDFYTLYLPSFLDTLFWHLARVAVTFQIEKKSNTDSD